MFPIFGGFIEVLPPPPLSGHAIKKKNFFFPKTTAEIVRTSGPSCPHPHILYVTFFYTAKYTILFR